MKLYILISHFKSAKTIITKTLYIIDLYRHKNGVERWTFELKSLYISGSQFYY